MAKKCTDHFNIVAMKVGIPGAYASCVDEPQFSDDFIRRELKTGAMLMRVSCDESHRLLGMYLKWCDRQDKRKSATTPKKA